MFLKKLNREILRFRIGPALIFVRTFERPLLIGIGHTFLRGYHGKDFTLEAFHCFEIELAIVQITIDWHVKDQTKYDNE